MNSKIAKGILKALAYSDIFDFPLNDSEIYKFYVGKKPCFWKTIVKTLSELKGNKLIESDGRMHCLSKQRRQIFSVRKKREKESKVKMKKALLYARLIGLIPQVLVVGISGSLASCNAQKTDDIDFFIITSRNSLWIARFFVATTLLIFGQKRGRFAVVATDKICPNMFLSEDALGFRGEDKNLFIAWEIIQLKVLINKKNTYERFLLANLWISDFLPNALNFKNLESKILSSQLSKASLGHFNPFTAFFNRVFFLAQFAYMERHIKNEEVRRDIAKFHPVDKKYPILKLFELRYKHYARKVSIVKNNARSSLLKLSLDTPGY